MKCLYCESPLDETDVQVEGNDAFTVCMDCGAEGPIATIGCREEPISPEQLAKEALQLHEEAEERIAKKLQDIADRWRNADERADVAEQRLAECEKELHRESEKCSELERQWYPVEAELRSIVTDGVVDVNADEPGGFVDVVIELRESLMAARGINRGLKSHADYRAQLEDLLRAWDSTCQGMHARPRITQELCNAFGDARVLLLQQPSQTLSRGENDHRQRLLRLLSEPFLTDLASRVLSVASTDGFSKLPRPRQVQRLAKRCGEILGTAARIATKAAPVTYAASAQGSGEATATEQGTVAGKAPRADCCDALVALVRTWDGLDADFLRTAPEPFVRVLREALGAIWAAQRRSAETEIRPIVPTPDNDTYQEHIQQLAAFAVELETSCDLAFHTDGDFASIPIDIAGGALSALKDLLGTRTRRDPGLQFELERLVALATEELGVSQEWLDRANKVLKATQLERSAEFQADLAKLSEAQRRAHARGHLSPEASGGLSNTHYDQDTKASVSQGFPTDLAHWQEPAPETSAKRGRRDFVGALVDSTLHPRLKKALIEAYRNQLASGVKPSIELDLVALGSEMLDAMRGAERMLSIRKNQRANEATARRPGTSGTPSDTKDAVSQALDEAPLDDEPVTEQERLELNEARSEAAQGLGVSTAELKQRIPGLAVGSPDGWRSTGAAYQRTIDGFYVYFDGTYWRVQFPNNGRVVEDVRWSLSRRAMLDVDRMYPANVDKRWTLGEDNRYNTSAAFRACEATVVHLMKNHRLEDPLEPRAGMIVAQLAGIHGLRPPGAHAELAAQLEEFRSTADEVLNSKSEQNVLLVWVAAKFDMLLDALRG